MVNDGEILHRRIFRDDITAERRLSSTAFNDRGRKPSVNRATLSGSPAATQESPTDGVVQLVTNDVRQVSVLRDPKSKEVPAPVHNVDVVERPIAADNPEGLPENPAHAQVEASPEFLTDSRFRKLKEALALLAEKHGFLIEPS